MIVDHDAAMGLLDFDCEEDPLRFEMEVWEGESSERNIWESLSSCSGSSDCERAEDCWVDVSEGSSRSGWTVSLDRWGGFELASKCLEGAAKNDESFVCPGFVPTLCFFVDATVIEDEGRGAREADCEGDAFLLSGRVGWESDSGGGEDVLVT